MDTQNISRKGGNPFRLIGAIIVGIVIFKVLLFNYNIIYVLLSSTHQPSSFIHIPKNSFLSLLFVSFIIFGTFIICGFITYYLVDKNDKNLVIGIISGTAIGIVVYFAEIFFFSLVIKIFLNPFEISPALLFIIPIPVGGFIAYYIGKSRIAAIVTTVLIPVISYLILLLSFLTDEALL